MKYLLFLIAFVTSFTASAQQDDTFYRLEIGGGVGLANTFTDVKGKMGFGAAAIARFPFNPRMAVKAQFTYATMKGETNGVKNFYPANPEQMGTEMLNYSVSNGIYDLSAIYELHFLPYGYVRDYKGYSRIVPYLQAGFGLTYGPAGKGFSPNIPLGLGLKYKVSPRLNLGMDWLVHFTLNDKLDGLQDPLGIESKGFRNKDHYSALTFTLTYDLNPRCPTCNRDR